MEKINEHTISIIIPVLNEEEWVLQSIDHLQKNAITNPEIIVVDGGSSDDTLNRLKNLPVKIVNSAKGRAVQMNTGAKVASGSVLYFLHVDSLPPASFDQQILEAIKKGFVSGCFRMKFDSRHYLLRFFGWLTRFNNRFCRGGDQSLFVLKKVFQQAGAYREDYIIYEDNEILPRLWKFGKFTVLKNPIITSARRYRENGVHRLQWIFARIHFGKFFGVSQERLLQFYKRKVK